MRLNPRVVSSAAAIAITCAVSAAAYFYRSRSAELNEVMVFCKLQFNAYSCFDKMISYVEDAKINISVCMPGIQNPAIQGRLLKVMERRNIKVRIIIDRTGMNDSNDFLIKELIDAGAEIKYSNDPLYHMQHKFCLVDDRVLMTGTLNWGNDRSSDHWNYVYITSKNQLVEPVKREFNEMWNQFSHISHNQERTTQEPNDSDAETSIVNPDTEVLECVQIQPCFRETVMTPEVYIM